MRVTVLVTLIAAGLLAGCNKPAESPTAAETASTPAAETSAATPAAAAAVDPAIQAQLAALPAPYNTADLENGQVKFALCRSCHTITEGGANLTGPNLHGVFGRQAGSVEKFRYSEPVKNAGFVWDGEHLDKWLADPRGFLPGNRMSFPGVKDSKDRTDLIAYLMVNTGHTPGG